MYVQPSPRGSANTHPVVVTLGFFDDIYVPRIYLPEPSSLSVLFHTVYLLVCTETLALCSDPNERAYFWVADPDSAAPDLLDTPLTSRMYIDASEVVRVRVEADEFYDDEPGPPKAQDGVMVNGQAKEREGRRAPYTITVRASFVRYIAVTDEVPRRSVPSLSKVLVLYRGGRMQGWKRWTRKAREVYVYLQLWAYLCDSNGPFFVIKNISCQSLRLLLHHSLCFHYAWYYICVSNASCADEQIVVPESLLSLAR